MHAPNLVYWHAERAVEGNLLFDMLSLPARQAIFRSMALQMVSGGTTIISQGDTDATKFYVLEKGTCDVLISSDATGNVPKKVHTYTSGRYSTWSPCNACHYLTIRMAHCVSAHLPRCRACLSCPMVSVMI